MQPKQKQVVQIHMKFQTMPILIYKHTMANIQVPLNLFSPSVARCSQIVVICSLAALYWNDFNSSAGV